MKWRDMRWAEKIAAPAIFAAGLLAYYTRDIVAWFLALIGL
jgi:hypothetical protein